MMAARGRTEAWTSWLGRLGAAVAPLCAIAMLGCSDDGGDGTPPTTIELPGEDAGAETGAETGAEAGAEAAAEAEAAVPPPAANLEGPLARIDIVYTYDVAAQDPLKETRSWTLATGELPDGLKLSETGKIEGTPTKSEKSSTTLLGQGACGTAACRWEVHLAIEVAPVVLLGGFGPFSYIKENPSWLAIEKLDRELIAAHDVRTVWMPVSWDNAPLELFKAYDHLRPVITIASGVDTGAEGVRLESKAVNLAVGKDVDGVNKPSGPIDPDGPDSLPTLLPVEDLRVKLELEGFTVGISESAGNFLCNFIFYDLMQKLASEPPESKLLGGFVHVPSATKLEPAKMTEAWRVIVAHVVSYRAALIEGKRYRGDLPPTITIFQPPKYD